MKPNYFLMFVIMLVVVINSRNGYAAYFNATNQSVEGGTEAILYGTNTVVVENTITSNGLVPGAVPDKGISIGSSPSGFYSENYKIYYLPISFTILNSINLSASIPYIFKSVNDDGEKFEAKGLGDISGGIAYFTDYREKMTGTTSLKVTFPTGDNTKSDRGYYIPLGSGAYSFNLNQSLSQSIGDLRVYLNGSIIYSLESKKMVVGDTQYQFRKGMVYSGLIGFEYTFFEMIIVSLKFNYVNIAEGQVKTQWTGWEGANDSLQTSDAIAGIKIDIFKDIFSLFAMYVHPVYTKNDPSVNDPKTRKGGISFGASGFF